MIFRPARRFSLLLVISFFGACTLRPPSAQVSLRLAAPPAEATKFSCYFVDASGEGIVPTALAYAAKDSGVAGCLALTSVSRLVSAQQMQSPGVTLSLAPGKNRRLRIFGVMTDGFCEGSGYLSELLAAHTDVSVYELGSRTADLFHDERVPITVSSAGFDKTDKLAGCRAAAGTLGLSPAGPLTLSLGDDVQFTPSGGAAPYAFVGSPYVNASGYYGRPWQSTPDSFYVVDANGAKSQAVHINLPPSALAVGAAGTASTNGTPVVVVGTDNSFHLFGTTTGDLSTGSSGGTDFFYLHTLVNGHLMNLVQGGQGATTTATPLGAAWSLTNGAYVIGRSDWGSGARKMILAHPVGTPSASSWFTYFGGTTSLQTGGAPTRTEPAAVKSIAFDSSGNLIVTGTTYDVLTYGHDNGTPTYGAGGCATFIAKFKPDGTPLWLSGLGSGNGSNTQAVDLVVTGTDIFVTGTTDGTIPSPPLVARRAENRVGSSVFIAKLNVSDGSFVSGGVVEWTPASVGAQPTRMIYHAGSGMLYLAGQTGPVFGNTTHTVGTYGSTGLLGWAAKVRASDLALQWLTEIHGGFGTTTRPSQQNGLFVDGNGDAYVTGTTTGTIFSSPSSGSQDGFLVRLAASNGWEVTGSTQFGGASTTNVSPSTLLVAGGKAYVYGSRTGFQLSGSTFPSGMGSGNSDVFVSVTDFSVPGTAIYELGMPAGMLSDITSGEDARNHSLYVDSTGNIYVAGTASGITNLGGSASFIGSPGSVDGFVVKLTPSGAAAWVKEIAGNSVGIHHLEGQGGALFVAGTSVLPLPAYRLYGKSGNGPTEFLIKLDSAGVQQ